MIKKNTQAGEIKSISLDNFLLKTIAIQIVQVDENNLRVRYIEWLSCMKTYMDAESQDAQIELKKSLAELRLHRGVKSLREDFSETLRNNLVNIPIAPENFLYELEDRIAESMIEYCEPSFLVHVGHRTWVVADPRDFIIFKSKCSKYYKLVCLHKYRNKIYRYGKR